MNKEIKVVDEKTVGLFEERVIELLNDGFELYGQMEIGISHFPHRGGDQDFYRILMVKND